MSGELSADRLQQVLVRHDPLAFWLGVGRAGASDYRREAELAAAGLEVVLGLGHVRTVVADAIDRVHPGFYRAAESDGKDELSRRLSRIAREVWDLYAIRLGAVRRAAVPPAPPPPPTAAALALDEGALVDWLREVERQLVAEPTMASGLPRPATSLLLATLPRLVDQYVASSAEVRASARQSFSRFRFACHRLSGFAALQARLIRGGANPDGLRRCLLAESLLDLHTDWRDELLMLRDLRRAAAASGLAFDEEVERAANASSETTAAFLRGLLSER